jgi:hypothetical protein
MRDLNFTGFGAVFTIRSANHHHHHHHHHHLQGLVHLAHSGSTVSPTGPYISSMVGLYPIFLLGSNQTASEEFGLLAFFKIHLFFMYEG